MLDQKYFGLSVMTWIVIVVLLVYIWCSRNKEFFSDTNNNDNQENKDSKIKVYNFNTSWCGYSKQFQPTWDEFQKKYKSDNRVIVKDVKCDETMRKL